MSVKRFKFVSPGIFLNEIDNSQLPRLANAVGPTVIGRTERGPGMVPLTVDSFQQFIEVFGNPIPGGQGGDIWREGNYSAPTYASYAAQAFLRNSGPVNVVRLLGIQDPNASASGVAGWTLDGTSIDGSDPTSNTKSSAYGLYLFSTGAVDKRETTKGNAATAVSQTTLTGTLAAIWYFQQGAINLSGNIGHLHGARAIDHHHMAAGAVGTGDAAITGSHALIKSTNHAKMEFVAHLYDKNSASNFKRVVFNFDRDSDKYIRKVFNTNPILTNGDITADDSKELYFLGETFDRFVRDNHGKGSGNTLHKGLLSADESLCAFVAPLLKETVPQYDHTEPNRDSVTGWVFSQDVNTSFEGYTATDMQKLFKFVGINDGGAHAREIKISITDLKLGTDTSPYGSFTVLIRNVKDNDARPQILERFTQCSLDPNSVNYIARKIGDQFREWDNADKRYRVYGNFANQSKFVRVKMHQDVDAGTTDAKFLPFGFYGPIRYAKGTLATAAAKRLNHMTSPALWNFLVMF